MRTTKAIRRSLTIRAHNRKANILWVNSSLGWRCPKWKAVRYIRNRVLVTNYDLDWHIRDAYAKINRIDDAMNYEMWDEGLATTPQHGRFSSKWANFMACKHRNK